MMDLSVLQLDEREKNGNSEAADLEGFSFPLNFGKVTGKRKVNTNTQKREIHEKKLSSALCSLIRPQDDICQPPAKRKNECQELYDSGAAQAPIQYNDEEEEQTFCDIPELFVPKEAVFSFNAHMRCVTTMAVNPKSTILVSGGRDAEIKFWDFYGMTCEPAPFRQITPLSTHCIRSLSYSLGGSHILCAAGDAVCRVYDIKGEKRQETVKGDMYVRDLSQTKGHTHALTDCCWHPFDRDKFFTASEDATVRVFDLNAKPYGVDQALPHLHLLKAVDKRNLNIASQCRVTCVCVAPFSAKVVLAGCSDGSLQQWNERHAYGKPDKVLRTAHMYDTEVSDIQLLHDETRVLSRGLDGTMKLWDLRQFTKPVYGWENLENNILGAGLCVNPDQNLGLTGTSSNTNEAFLSVFELSTGKQVETIKFTTVPQTKTERVKGFGISKVLWPEDLNQLIVSCGDGTIRFCYDHTFSRKGCLSFISRPPPNRKKTFEGFQTPIFTVDSLPRGYKETRFGRICRVKLRDQDTKNERSFSDKPIKLANAPAKFLSRNTEEKEKKIAPFSMIAKEDPVESIRAYAEKAAAEPIFTGQAYKDAQPVPILDYSMEITDEEKLMSHSNSCPRCGLKFCQCGYMALSKSLKRDTNYKIT